MTRLRGLAAAHRPRRVIVGVPWLLRPATGTGRSPASRSASSYATSSTPSCPTPLVFAVLTVAAWVVWAVFMLSVLVEVVAAVRGVQAPRLAFAGPLQRSARASSQRSCSPSRSTTATVHRCGRCARGVVRRPGQRSSSTSATPTAVLRPSAGRASPPAATPDAASGGAEPAGGRRDRAPRRQRLVDRRRTPR